jgi:hypothetical protein
VTASCTGFSSIITVDPRGRPTRRTAPLSAGAAAAGGGEAGGGGVRAGAAGLAGSGAGFEAGAESTGAGAGGDAVGRAVSLGAAGALRRLSEGTPEDAAAAESLTAAAKGANPRLL